MLFSHLGSTENNATTRNGRKLDNITLCFRGTDHLLEARGMPKCQLLRRNFWQTDVDWWFAVADLGFLVAL